MDDLYIDDMDVLVPQEGKLLAIENGPANDAGAGGDANGPPSAARKKNDLRPCRAF